MHTSPTQTLLMESVSLRFSMGMVVSSVQSSARSTSRPSSRNSQSTNPKRTLGRPLKTPSSASTECWWRRRAWMPWLPSVRNTLIKRHQWRGPWDFMLIVSGFRFFSNLFYRRGSACADQGQPILRGDDGGQGVHCQCADDSQQPAHLCQRRRF